MDYACVWTLYRPMELLRDDAHMSDNLWGELRQKIPQHNANLAQMDMKSPQVVLDDGYGWVNGVVELHHGKGLQQKLSKLVQQVERMAAELRLEQRSVDPKISGLGPDALATEIKKKFQEAFVAENRMNISDTFVLEMMEVRALIRDSYVKPILKAFDKFIEAAKSFGQIDIAQSDDQPS